LKREEEEEVWAVEAISYAYFINVDMIQQEINENKRNENKLCGFKATDCVEADITYKRRGKNSSRRAEPHRKPQNTASDYVLKYHAVMTKKFKETRLD
jgi:hypothetical protein